MNKFEWIFRVFDKASAPARAIDNALGKLQDRFKGAGTAAGGFMKHLQDLFFLKEAVGLVADLATKLHELGREVVAGIAFKQNALIGLEALSGTRDRAIEIFEDVEDFAWKTGQSVASVMAVTKDLLSAGFDSGEARYMQQLLGDLAIIDPGKAAALAGVLADIGRKGELSGRQLMQLKGVLSFNDLVQEASGVLGLPVTLDMIEKRGIKARDAVEAITNVLLKRYSKGSAGSLLEMQAKTIPALLAKVRAIPERIIDELAGFGGGTGGTFARILENIANAFDPTGPSGRRIIESLRGLLAQVGAMFGVSGGEGGLIGELAGPNGVQAIERIFTALVRRVELALPTVKTFASAFLDIAKAVTTVADTVGFMSGGLGDRIYRNLHPGEFGAAPTATYRNGAWVPDVQPQRTSSPTTNQTLEATFNIHGVSAADGDKLQMSITEAIADAFERLAYQRGVAPYPVR